ncbi:MAG TPA: hypothetical protein VKU00_29410 [Chthonomonadaceae bacterium]|nr:hypothetical protein [Chthonomonadaceae bacterium]
MGVTDGPEYRWYMLGCGRFGWDPLAEEEFWPKYRRYRRCSRAIQKFEQRRVTRKGGPGGLFGAENRLLERLLRNVIRERDQLDYLANAVSAGQSADGGDSGGTGVKRRPKKPVLAGAGAKPLPHLDPDPPVRNP